MLAIRAGAWLRAELAIEILPHNEAAAHRAILLAIVAYILLTAIPFVPGAEIGMTLLTVFGPVVAPLIYGATIVSLSLSFLVGRLVPPETTIRVLRFCRFQRAADGFARFAAMPPEDRAAGLFERVDHPALRRLVRHRYVALALLINLPGNVVVGGGGGLAMMAGLSRVFSPAGFLLTVAIAVLPVPLMVFFAAG